MLESQGINILYLLQSNVSLFEKAEFYQECNVTVDKKTLSTEIECYQLLQKFSKLVSTVTTK